MITELSILNDVGLHARPAATFVKEAASFESSLLLRKDGREANAKSILSVLQLDVRQGDTLELVAEGADAAAACGRLRAVVAGL
jgi:phosphotransferase system HPr (HPr) family protein